MADLDEERIDRTLIVRLRRDTITPEMLDRFDEVLERARHDRGLRALVIAGGDPFSLGFDLPFLRALVDGDRGAESVHATIGALQDRFSRLAELALPTIAAIEGACVGAGVELALACDFRVASVKASFSLPETRLGFLPDLGGTARLTRLVGPARAKEWILPGRAQGAARAFEIGLLTEVAPPGQALDRALRLAGELAGGAPLAVAHAKRAIDRAADAPLADGLRAEREAMVDLLASDDLREGIAALVEKRPPKFNGR